MKYTKRMLAAAAVLFGLASQALSTVQVLQKDNIELGMGGRAQLMGLGQNVADAYRSNNRLYLFLKQARITMAGRYENVKFNGELAFGGEDQVVAPNPGVSLTLLDLSFDIPVPLFESSYLKVGQFKVPYGREQLAYSEYSQFADRSIQNLAFRTGRDVGAAFHTYWGNKTLIAGVFTGGGRDLPQRYLPQVLGFPLVVARAGIGNADDDAFVLRQNYLDLKETKAGVFVNGLYTRDSLVGHSTVLNVKLAEKSLLTNSNWNPFIGKTPLVQGNLWQVGADTVLRTPWRGISLSAEAEANYGGYSNSYGSLHMAGGRAQVGAYRKPVEFSLRYAFILPDEKFAKSNVPITGKRIIQEVVPGLTYYLKGHRMKIVADAPILIGVPVLTEKNVGAYVSTEQPDQTTVLGTGGTVKRETVPEARLMFQISF